MLLYLHVNWAFDKISFNTNYFKIMIQRIQSLWLLLAAAAILLVLKFPIAALGEQTYQTNDKLYLYILAVLLALLSFVTIFLFKKRSVQKQLIWIGILSSILFIILMYLPAKSFIEANAGAGFTIGAVLPVIYIIFLILAYSGIRKDEKLIKSIDRLR
jgi:peptidoglycan/LPS O-acetylase OafA/YrhL